MSNEVLPMLNLIDSEWCSWHHNNYKWGTIPETDNPEYRNELILIPCDNTEKVKTEQVKDDNKPSKKDPVFYRVFADLPGDLESFIKFSNEYGPPIENLSQLFFIQEQWLLKMAVKLYDYIQGGKFLELKHNHSGLLSDDFSILAITGNIPNIRLDMAITDNMDYYKKRLLDRSSFDVMGTDENKPWIGVYVDKENKPFAVVCKDPINDELIKKPIDFFYKAFLREIINSQLNKFPAPFNLFQNPDTNIFKQVVRPTSLLSFMWYQFFQEVTGEKKYKQCNICQGYSDITKVKGDWDHHPECAIKVRVDRTRRRQRGEDIPLRSPGRPKKKNRP